MKFQSMVWWFSNLVQLMIRTSISLLLLFSLIEKMKLLLETFSSGWKQRLMDRWNVWWRMAQELSVMLSMQNLRRLFDSCVTLTYAGNTTSHYFFLISLLTSSHQAFKKYKYRFRTISLVTFSQRIYLQRSRIRTKYSRFGTKSWKMKYLVFAPKSISFSHQTTFYCNDLAPKW